MDAFLAPLTITSETSETLAYRLSETYRALALTSKDQFLTTPVSALPTGQEKGRFLAIDVGGSNLRVAFVDLLGSSITNAETIRRTHEKSWPIEDRLKIDNPLDLFSWIGSCIAEVIDDSLNVVSVDPRPETPNPLPIGVTFSFPMEQTTIAEASLMPMGKGFNITSDLNLGRMIMVGYSEHVRNRSLNANQLPNIRIAAITNDAVATLASLAYSAKALPNAKVAMGLIMGTGTNATIEMPMDRLARSKQQLARLHTARTSSSVVVNTEWTIRGASQPLWDLNLVTSWDEDLDRNSEAPGFQPFEYMTAGRYIGEIVRLATYEYFTQHEGWQGEDLPLHLQHRNALSTLFLSSVIAPAHSSSEILQTLTDKLHASNTSSWAWTEDRVTVVRKITQAVQIRSCKMVASAVIGLLACAGELALKNDSNDLHTNDRSSKSLIVAYTGGVICQFPNYLQTCQAAIDELVHTIVDRSTVDKVLLHEAQHGGVLGAGVLAGTVWNLHGS